MKKGFQSGKLLHVLWDNLVNGKNVEVHRMKGLLVHGNDVRVVQGVRDTYEIIENGKLLEEVKENKLVFIGKTCIVRICKKS